MDGENNTKGEEREMLENLMALTQENNKMLHGLYRSMQWSRALRIVYILVILSIMFGTYYYIQPYVGDLVDAYLGTQNLLHSLPTEVSR